MTSTPLNLGSEFADQVSFPWNPICSREPIQWPKQARVAVAIVVLMEASSVEGLSGPFSGLLPGGGGGNKPYPDAQRFTHREYGHRVGIFRLLDLFKSRALPCALAVDARTTTHYPRVIQAALSIGAEFIAHGDSAAEIITSQMTEEREHSVVEGATRTIAKAIGKVPVGWLGPAYSESVRTVGLLAAQGYDYVCDWCNDDQPYEMRQIGWQSTLISLPTLFELDDAKVLLSRGLSEDAYGRMLSDAFDQLWRDAEQFPRIMVVCVRPWIMGQAFRLQILEAFLDEVLARNAWVTTPGAIATAYRMSRTDIREAQL